MAKRQVGYFGEFAKGIFAENPTFVIMLGICPTLAVTTQAKNGVAMGLAATGVLVASNTLVSMLRNVIPDKVRIPCFIVVIAAFVTMVEMIINAYSPALNAAMGIFIPLIVVNCIILGRAEGFASKHSVGRSILDGLGVGLGFTLSLTLIGTLREVIGNGTFLGTKLVDGYTPVMIMTQAPGAFLTLGLLLGFFTWIRLRRRGARP